MEPHELIEQMRTNLPVAFGRQSIDHLLPGVLTSKTLANMSSKGEGPPFFRQGRKVMYERDTFLEWLHQRIR